MDSKKKVFFHFRPLFYGFLALMLAICSTRYLFAGNVKYIILVSVAIVLFFVYTIVKKNFIALIVIICVFLFGMGWYFVGVQTSSGNVYEGVCTVEGRISDNYKENWSISAVLKDVKINGKRESNIYLRIDKVDDVEISIGDIVCFESEVSNARMFNLESFSSSFYRNKTPYICNLKDKDIEIKDNKLTFDEKFRLHIKNILYQNMGEENGTVAFAVLFGDKTDLDDEVRDAYASAGIIHVLTVSGLHISFLTLLIGFVLRLCKIRGFWNFLICFFMLGGYAYLCGFPPSVLRAGIMGLVLLASTLTGKCYDNLNTLGLAGIIILLFSPMSALDIGFQMSFFCVLSIFVVAPILSKLFKKFLPKYVADSFSVSIAASIGILPAGANIFAVTNLLSFFVNLIVIPVFGFIYPLLFVSTLLTCALPFFGFLLKVCGWGFSFIYGVAKFFGSTHLIFDLEPFNIILVAIAAIFLFLTSKFFIVSKKVRLSVCSVVLALFFAVAGILQIPVNKNSSLSYCYNYGTTTLLKNNSGKSVLIDMQGVTFTKRLKYVQNTQISALFVLNEGYEVEDIRECEINNVITCQTEKGYDEEIPVAKDEQGEVAGFKFTYKTFNQKLIGLEIEFDEIKVFVVYLKVDKQLLQNSQLGYYDFVLIGERDDFADCFSQCKIVLSVYENEYVNSSYSTYGNVCFDINGKNFKWRCLD